MIFGIKHGKKNEQFASYFRDKHTKDDMLFIKGMS